MPLYITEKLVCHSTSLNVCHFISLKKIVCHSTSLYEYATICSTLCALPYSLCLVSGWTKTSLAHFFGISFILVQMVNITGKNLIVLPSAQKSLSTMAYAQRRMMQTLSRIVRIPVMTTPPVLEKQRQHLSGHWGHPPPPQRPPEPLFGAPPPQPHIFLN